MVTTGSRTMMPQSLGRRGQGGLTLVEIMVALVISLVLSAGLIHIFLGNQQSYRFNQEFSRIQENSRFAVDMLGRSIRMAGFVGCARPGEVRVNNIVDPQEDGDFDPEFAVEGVRSVDAGVTVGNREVVSGTDMVTIRGGDGATGRMIEQSVSNANIKAASNAGNWEAGDVLIVSDCEDLDIFRATNVSQNTGQSDITIAHASNENVTNRLSKVYEDGASVISYRETTYFISPGQGDVPALWRRIGNQNPEEIVEGVEDMRILYGLDTNGNGEVNNYRGGQVVTNQGRWGDVISIRVSLLLVSLEDNTVDEPQSYVFNGARVTADDRRLRQIATTTVAVRNRLP